MAINNQKRGNSIGEGIVVALVWLVFLYIYPKFRTRHLANTYVRAWVFCEKEKPAFVQSFKKQLISWWSSQIVVAAWLAKKTYGCGYHFVVGWVHCPSWSKVCRQQVSVCSAAYMLLIPLIPLSVLPHRFSFNVSMWAPILLPCPRKGHQLQWEPNRPHPGRGPARRLNSSLARWQY